MQKKYQEMLGGNDLKRMLAGAYRAFLREKEILNSLNVFPVADGDTGTNMFLTMQAVVFALEKLTDTSSIGLVSKVASDTAILGARGNSGVILSQFIRGLGRVLVNKKEASGREMGKAFQYGIIYAYRAVDKPVEGTILTVARGMAKGARGAIKEGKSIDKLLAEAINAGVKEVQKTPELLPLLKEAGVVDAGGQGLLVFMQGSREGLANVGGAPESDLGDNVFLKTALTEENNDLIHPYCTEFILKSKFITKEMLKKTFSVLGDSLVLADGEGFVKVHLHTLNPGQVLDKALAWGSLSNIKIENMSEQVLHVQTNNQNKVNQKEKNIQNKKSAVLAVVSGKGFQDIYQKIGLKIMVDGGKTDNPPVEEFLKVAHSINAESFVILPNNKNTLLVAQQVKKLLNVKSKVLPTFNAIQGLAAALVFDENKLLEENLDKMKKAVAEIKTGAVSKAVRDSEVDNIATEAGDYIVLVEGKVCSAKKYLSVAVKKLIEILMHKNVGVVSLYYGNNVDEKTACKIAAEMKLHYENCDIELYDGGQNTYHFWVSVE